MEVKNMSVHDIHNLARIAGCDTPMDQSGEGATWLRECMSEALDMKSEMRGRHDDDLIHEIADGLVPVYTHQLWQVWVDLGGFNFDGEYRDFSSHGDSGDSMNRVAQADCFEWASTIVGHVSRDGY
tara:strand:+ start:4509 stop:4886 length:378 start_codon:yes stop_codon:yes gene_type:complete